MDQIDFGDVITRALKYIIEGFAVGLACYFVSKKLSWNEILIISITAASIFILLDIYSPSISGATRLGAGIGLGSRLIGFNVGSGLGLL